MTNLRTAVPEDSVFKGEKAWSGVVADKSSIDDPEEGIIYESLQKGLDAQKRDAKAEANYSNAWRACLYHYCPSCIR